MAKKSEYERVPIAHEAELRAWLTEHHERDEGVWLVLWKKHTGDRYVPWESVVRQLLCFGWIDSQVNRLDDDRLERLIAPRRAGSHWSALNKRHVESLQASGLMTPAGQAKIDRAMGDGSWEFLDDIEALVVPDDLAAALAGLRDAWDRAAASIRKQALFAVKSAKRAPTRERRIANIVARLGRGEPPA